MKTVTIHMAQTFQTILNGFWSLLLFSRLAIYWSAFCSHFSMSIRSVYVQIFKLLAKSLAKYEHYVPTWSRCCWQRLQQQQRRLRRQRRRRQQTMLLVHDVDRAIHNQNTLYKSEIGCMVGCFRCVCVCVRYQSLAYGLVLSMWWCAYKFGHLVRTSGANVCVCSVCVSEKSSYDFVESLAWDSSTNISKFIR